MKLGFNLNNYKTSQYATCYAAEDARKVYALLEEPELMRSLLASHFASFKQPLIDLLFRELLLLAEEVGDPEVLAYFSSLPASDSLFIFLEIPFTRKRAEEETSLATIERSVVDDVYQHFFTSKEI
jgi:hypothetical protein